MFETVNILQNCVAEKLGDQEVEEGAENVNNPSFEEQVAVSDVHNEHTDRSYCDTAPYFLLMENLMAYHAVFIQLSARVSCLIPNLPHHRLYVTVFSCVLVLYCLWCVCSFHILSTERNG